MASSSHGPAEPVATPETTPVATVAEAPQEQEPDGLRRRLLRARYCLHCNVIKADGPSHKQRTKHEYRALTDEERADEAARWRLGQTGDKTAQKHGMQERRAAQHCTWSGSHLAAVAPADYTLTFGKHKGKTLAKVAQRDPDYLAWCVASKVHTTNPGLMDALSREGMREQVLRRAEELRAQLKARRETARGESGHKDVQTLVRLQLQNTLRDEDEPLFPEDMRRKGQKRTHKSKAVVQIHNCLICGSSEHKRSTCPQNRQAALVQSSRNLRELALRKVKKEAALVARLKYTPVHQRTEEYESRPTQRSRAMVSRSFLDFARMRPDELTRALIDDGLLPDLEGAPCPNVKCRQQTRGYCNDQKLGRLSCATKVDLTFDLLSRENVCYRCKACRCRIPVTRGLCWESRVQGQRTQLGQRSVVDIFGVTRHF